MPKVKVWQLDPTEGTPGQVAKINDDGTEAEWADETGGGITGLTSVDDSVTITDNGDGTLDLAAAGGMVSIVAGTHIDVDATDPANPVISAYVPLTTVVDGVPDLVWDADNNLITTKGP